MSAYSHRYEAALTFAAQAHQGQLRKGSQIPYITHGVHVSTLLLRYGYNEDVVLAGLLHDVIEDCGVSSATLAEQFGDEVARLVVAVSKPPRPHPDPRGTLLAQVEQGGPLVAALKAADMLHNTRSLLHDMAQRGPQIWQHFRYSFAETLDYYQRTLAVVRTWIGWHPLCTELDSAVAELAAQYAALHAET